MTGKTTAATGAMTGKTTAATGATTGKTTAATGATTGKMTAATGAVAGPGCSGNRELDDQGGHTATWASGSSCRAAATAIAAAFWHRSWRECSDRAKLGVCGHVGSPVDASERRAGSLAVVIFVFLSQPTGIVVMVIAIVLLIVRA
jgi:hypothetical protein